MTRRPAPTAAVIVLLVAAAAGYRWWSSPDRLIRAILDDVAEALTHTQPDQGLQSLSAVAGLQQHLAIAAVVELPQTRVAGRQEIVALAARVRAASPSLRVRFFDPAIEFDGPAAARVTATAEVTMRDESGQDGVVVYQVAAMVSEVDGNWVVITAQVTPAGGPDS